MVNSPPRHDRPCHRPFSKNQNQTVNKMLSKVLEYCCPVNSLLFLWEDRISLCLSGCPHGQVGRESLKTLSIHPRDMVWGISSWNKCLYFWYFGKRSWSWQDVVIVYVVSTLGPTSLGLIWIESKILPDFIPRRRSFFVETDCFWTYYKVVAFYGQVIMAHHPVAHIFVCGDLNTGKKNDCTLQNIMIDLFS